MSEKLKSEPLVEEKYPLKRICSWCEKELGFTEATEKEPGGVTNTICEECKKKFYPEYYGDAKEKKAD